MYKPHPLVQKYKKEKKNTTKKRRKLHSKENEIAYDVFQKKSAIQNGKIMADAFAVEKLDTLPKIAGIIPRIKQKIKNPQAAILKNDR